MSFKSFLSWIQSDESNPKGKSGGEPIDWNEKRRDNRIDLSVERQLMVHLMSENAQDDSAETLEASVRNVSVRGCGLVFKNAGDRAKLQAQQVLLAALNVDDFSIPLKVEVVRLVGELEAAVRFKPPYPRELEKLEKFLEPRCLGRSLREIDRAKLQNLEDRGFRWFQGVNETHLFNWFSDDGAQVVQQQLIFLDRVVEWKQGGPVRTGRIRPDEQGASGSKGWVRSELMDYDGIPDSSLLNQAKILIESSQTEEKIKQEFLKKLS